jgi:D-tyrosyl-tRNA(Tyr) deacylase
MRALVQRAAEGQVVVGSEVVGAIGRGLVVFVGVGADDEAGDADWLAGKIAELRIFEDEAGKFARSVTDAGGEILAVSQFTLHADTRKGRRPSFTRAAPPERAERLYEQCIAAWRARGLPVATGRFGARMLVHLTNDGPVTIWLDSRER